MNRAAAYARAVTGVADLARELGDRLPPRTYLSLWHGSRPWPYRMAEIAADVCAARGVTICDLRSPNERSAVASGARQHFMFEAYATGQYSLAQIGRFLGRHHTTVLHGIRAHKARCG